MTDAEKARISKEYLQQVGNIKQQIALISERLEDLRSRAESIPSMEYGKTFSNPDKSTSRVERFQVKIADCIEQLVAKHDSLLRTENVIIEQVQRLPFQNERDVLLWRYIELKTIEETSIMLGCTYRHTTRIHGTALLTFHALYLDDTCTMMDSPL